MFYRRLAKGLNDFGKLIPADDNVYKHIDNTAEDWYLSIYKYNDDQYEQFEATQSVKGITDVVTDRVCFDFDSELEPSLAKDDSFELCNRLIQHGVPEKSLIVSFSGNKGFGVEIHLEEDLTPKQVKTLAFHLAGDLSHFDRKIYNASRILRIPYTKHPISGLYKVLIPFQKLGDTNLDKVTKAAKDRLDLSRLFEFTKLKLPEGLRKLTHDTKDDSKYNKIVSTELSYKGLDWKRKPKWLSNCRYALQNGFFKEGLRSHALLCLASTYKNLGFDIPHVYRLLKGVAEMQAQRNGVDRFPDQDIWDTIISQVFSSGWNGGQYTCKDPLDTFLQPYCQSLGPNKCQHNEDKALVELTDLADTFRKFTTEIESNRLKTGIQKLDENVLISTSMLVGLLAAPSAGKTQTTFNILNQSSKNGISNMFFSMDMSLPLVYTRLIQKHKGLDRDEVFRIFREDPKQSNGINEILKKEYQKTKFCFKGGLTTDEMREAIMAQQDKSGEKVKLVAIDYLECISGPYSDSTANTAIISQKLKDIANELEVCVWLLLQTQKSSGDPSDPLLSMRNVKGASAIEQACSVIISLSRPGFSPVRGREDDHFITISTVKDRMGALLSEDFGWDGLTGEITELSVDEKEELDGIRNRKKAEQAAASPTNWV